MLGFERARTRNFDFDYRANMRWPRAQHYDLIGKKYGFSDVMRYKDHRLPGARPDVGQFNLELFTSLRVHRGKGFIEEQYIGIDRKSAGEIGALLHSAGQFRRMAMLEAAQTDEIDERLHFGRARLIQTALQFQTISNVVPNRAPG